MRIKIGKPLEDARANLVNFGLFRIRRTITMPALHSHIFVRSAELCLVLLLFAMAYFGYHLSFVESTELGLLLFICIELVCLTQYFIRINTMHRLINQNDEMARLVEKIVRLLIKIKSRRHISILKVTESLVSEFCDELTSLANGNFEHGRGSPHAFGRIAIYLTRETLDAVSSFLGSGRLFWSSAIAGAVYQEANEWCVRQHIRFRRIFLATDLSDQDWKVMLKQERMGIDVYVVFVTEIAEDECFIIQDDSFVSDTHFDCRLKIKGWTQSESPRKLKRLRKKFDHYLRLSKPLKKIKGYREFKQKYAD